MKTPIRSILLATVAALCIVAGPAAGALANQTSDATPGAPAGEAAPPTMKIQFTGHRAPLAGSRALVRVKCAGYETGTCVGTLALSGPAGAHKIPYSLERGESRILAVPLGEECDSMGAGSRARVVASTLQLTGTSILTSATLRIK
jgi:hypothetical protein